MPDSRIDQMVANWEKEGRAFSHLNNDDSMFFTRINKTPDRVGVTSQCGSDLLYYDSALYESDYNAIRSRKIN